MKSIPKFIGKYRVIEEIGSGGMAVVYKCHDEDLGRFVAVKVIHPNLTRDEDKMERFQREARVVASLDHQNIVRVYDYISDDLEFSYIVTEYIEGMTLRGLLEREGNMFSEVAAMVVIDLCKGLGQTHQHGIVHRDIKPENVMIRDDGVLKLTDFGVAHIMDLEQTGDGMLVGSLAYMSPEQAKGEELDGRSDIFSLGILLYEMITGRHPFREEGMSPLKVLERIHNGKYTPPDEIRSGLGTEMVSIIARCLMKNPAERYQDVGELEDALVGFLADTKINDYHRELKAYLVDSVSFNDDFRGRAGNALYEKGKQCLEEGQRGEAYRLLNRALCLKEGDENILSLLKVSGPSSLRRYALAACVVLAVTLILVLFLSNIYGPSTEPEQNIVAHEEVQPSAGDERAVKEVIVTTEHTVQVEDVPEVVSRKGLLEVFTRPWTKVYIDGTYRGNTPLVSVFELDEGGHTLRLTNPFCSPSEYTVEIIPEKPLIKRVQLKWCINGNSK